MTAPTRRRAVAVDHRQDHVRVTFTYDPAAVDVIRGVRGRRWHPAEKTWTVPSRSLDELCARYRAAGFDVNIVGHEPAISGPEKPARGLSASEATESASAILAAARVDCELCGATDVATWANDPWRLRVHRPGVAYQGAITPGGDRCHGHDRFVTELRNAGLAMVGPSEDGGRRRLATDTELSAAGGTINDIHAGGWL